MSTYYHFILLKLSLFCVFIFFGLITILFIHSLYFDYFNGYIFLLYILELYTIIQNFGLIYLKFKNLINENLITSPNPPLPILPIIKYLSLLILWPTILTKFVPFNNWSILKWLYVQFLYIYRLSIHFQANL